MESTSNVLEGEKVVPKLAEIEDEIKKIIVSHMQIDTPPEQIDSTQEFFLEGYGFNSIDALELLLRIETEFDIEISDEHLDAELVRTIRSISSYVLGKLEESNG